MASRDALGVVAAARGLDEPVRDFVLGQPVARRFLELAPRRLQLEVQPERREAVRWFARPGEHTERAQRLRKRLTFLDRLK